MMGSVAAKSTSGEFIARRKSKNVPYIPCPIRPEGSCFQAMKSPVSSIVGGLQNQSIIVHKADIDMYI